MTGTSSSGGDGRGDWEDDATGSLKRSEGREGEVERGVVGGGVIEDSATGDRARLSGLLTRERGRAGRG